MNNVGQGKHDKKFQILNEWVSIVDECLFRRQVGFSERDPHETRGLWLVRGPKQR